jgi:hypothetical protein
MVVLGLLLLIAAGVVTAGIVLQSTDPANAAAFGQTVTDLTVGRLFLAGVITGAIAVLGLSMILAGGARRRTRRAGLKRQVLDERGEKESLAEENARLQRELDAKRSGADVYPNGTAGRHADVDEDATTVGHGLFRR